MGRFGNWRCEHVLNRVIWNWRMCLTSSRISRPDSTSVGLASANFCATMSRVRTCITQSRLKTGFLSNSLNGNPDSVHSTAPPYAWRNTQAYKSSKKVSGKSANNVVLRILCVEPYFGQGNGHTTLSLHTHTSVNNWLRLRPTGIRRSIYTLYNQTAIRWQQSTK